MTMTGILYYIWYGATKLYNVFGSSTVWWMPATVAAYKLDLTSVIIILLLGIIFGWILYVLVCLCQMAINKFHEAVRIFSENNNYLITILGTLFIFVPILTVVAYMAYCVLHVIFYVALYTIGGHELVKRIIH